MTSSNGSLALAPGGSKSATPVARKRSWARRPCAAPSRLREDGVILSAGAGAWCPAISLRESKATGGAGGGTRTLMSQLSLYGFSYRLRLSPPGCEPFAAPASGLRSGLSLHRLPDRLRGLGAARLVSTPSRRDHSVGLGSGLPFHRFPRLWAVLHRRFPDEHSSLP